jgi:hypothetical protein
VRRLSGATVLADRGRQALLVAERLAFNTHQQVIPFLETLGFCGRGLHHDSALLGL